MASTRDKNAARALMRANPDLNYTAALRQAQATRGSGVLVIDFKGDGKVLDPWHISDSQDPSATPATFLMGDPSKPSDADRIRALLREQHEAVILDPHDSDGTSMQVARRDPDSPDGLRTDPETGGEPGA